MQQREKVDGLRVVTDEFRCAEVLMQHANTYLVCKSSWLHGGEWGDAKGPRSNQGRYLTRNLFLLPKPVHPADYMRTVSGTIRFCDSTQVLRKVRRRAAVREGVDIWQAHGIVATGTAVFCVEGFISG